MTAYKRNKHNHRLVIDQGYKSTQLGLMSPTPSLEHHC
jgi:hypothetical protein